MKAPSRFLVAVLALAMEVGKKILAIYRTRFRVGQNADLTPFTAADLASHHFLTEHLHTLNGGFPVLSADSPIPPYDERAGWETYWLVDPVDCAKEFIQRGDEFTVNIALIHQNKPVLGLVYAPALETCYFAAEGCGAFKKSGQTDPVEIQVRMQAPEHPVIASRLSDDTPQQEAYLQRLGGHETQFLGGSLKFCLIAEGLADLSPNLGLTSEWDTAAGQCIIEAAGGRVVDLQGRPLLYNAKPSLENPFFLAFGDTAQGWKLYGEGIAGSPPSAPPPPSPLLKAAIALALKAGGKILEIYHSEFRISHKQDQSPLTAADLAAHHCLEEGLQQLKGGYPVLSEESRKIPFEERGQWETYWLVDPLDGTREFIKRNGEFTVNIALIRNHRPVLGVVYAPVLSTCYFAEEGGGAFKQVGQLAPREIAVRQKAPKKPVVLGSRSHKTEELANYLDRLGEHELASIGSSLKFCKVAEGEADLYPRIGPTSEWDTAAAQCVVETAGGKVTDLDGEPLLYNTKPSLLNPYFLAFGDSSRDWTVPARELETETTAK